MTVPNLGATILAALKQAGKDVERLTPDDLAAVDEFHTGQRGATIRLAELLRLEGPSELSMWAAVLVDPLGFWQSSTVAASVASILPPGSSVSPICWRISPG